MIKPEEKILNSFNNKEDLIGVVLDFQEEDFQVVETLDFLVVEDLDFQVVE